MLNNIPIKEIKTLLDYNWSDEKADYYLNLDEDGGENHIFLVMQKIDEWITSVKKKQNETI